MRRESVGRVAGLAAAATLALGVGEASAYRLLGSNWDYMANPMGESLQICASGGPSGGATIVRQAGARWNYSQFSFSFQGDGCSSGGRYPTSNGINQVDFGSLGSGVLGETTTFYSTRTGGTTECDIRLNRSVSWYVGQGTVPSGRFDLFTIALHEFGHCLGLGHSSGPGWPVMYRSYETGEWNRAPTRDDVAGRNAIYGR